MITTEWGRPRSPNIVLRAIVLLCGNGVSPMLAGHRERETDMPNYRGSCHCGAVTFSLVSEITELMV
jgi:hypothetical protein